MRDQVLFSWDKRTRNTHSEKIVENHVTQSLQLIHHNVRNITDNLSGRRRPLALRSKTGIRRRNRKFKQRLITRDERWSNGWLVCVCGWLIDKWWWWFIENWETHAHCKSKLDQENHDVQAKKQGKGNFPATRRTDTIDFHKSALQIG